MIPSLEIDSLLTVGNWSIGYGLWVRFDDFWMFDTFKNKHFLIASLQVNISFPALV